MHVLTGKHSFEDYIEFMNGFSKKGTIMTETRKKGICKKVVRDIGCFIGKEILPKSCEEKNVFVCINLVCVWCGKAKVYL